MMNSMLSQAVYWHWLGLSALLFILEVVSGTGFLLCMGVAALITGIVLIVMPELSTAVQWTIFAVLLLLSAGIWKSYLYSSPRYQKKSSLNKRAEQYLGRVLTLEAPIVNGLGTLHVDDSLWRIKCATDLPEGAVVRVVGAEGVILLVEAVI